MPLVLLVAWFAQVMPAAARFVRWTVPVTLCLLAGSFFVPDITVFPLTVIFFAGIEVAVALARNGYQVVEQPAMGTRA